MSASSKPRKQNKKSKKQPDVAPSANPQMAHWMRELRKSSASGFHTPKPRRGSRAERERQAIRDQRRDQQ